MATIVPTDSHRPRAKENAEESKTPVKNKPQAPTKKSFRSGSLLSLCSCDRIAKTRDRVDN